MLAINTFRSFTGLLLFGLFTIQIVADDNGTNETIFLTGFPAPGIGGVDVLSPTGPGTINNSGEFTVTTLLATGYFERAWFSGPIDLPELIARDDDQAPDFPAGILMTITSPTSSGENGIVGFKTSLFGPGVDGDNNQAYFIGTPSDMHLAIHEGSALPGGGPGVNIGGIDVRAFNATGQLAALTEVNGIGVNATNNFAILARIDESLELVARLGDTAPGIGGQFTNWSDRILMNDSNEIVFVATTTTGSGVFRYSNGFLEVIAAEGDTAPGTEFGITYGAFEENNSFGLNNAGNVAFTANLVDLAGAQTHGIYSNADGQYELIAMTGQDAPGVPLSGNFNSFSGLVLNGSGDVAFFATLIGLGIDGTNNEALYTQINDSIRLVAREGSLAAGLVNGINYDEFSNLSMNQSGQVVFNATLKGNVTQANDSAIYVASNGYPQRLVREGFLFDVNEDLGVIDFRFIDELDQGQSLARNSGGEDGLRPGINNAGQVIFELRFTDDSAGSFVADCGFVLGDVNGDGVVNLLDVAPFVDLINAGGESPEADVNGDGNVDLLDVGPFISLLTA